MKSLPDIIKRNGFVLTEQKVRIPDFQPEIPLQEQPEVLQEQAEQPEEKVEQVMQEPPQPVPSPRRVQMPSIPNEEEFRAAYKTELERVCKKVAEEAYKKAYSDALQEKRGEIQKSLEELDRRLNEMQAMQTEYLEQYTEQLKYMAVDIAQKFVLQQIQEDDTLLFDLVMQAVDSVKKSDWLRVEVSDQLVNLVEMLRQELQKPEYQEKAEVAPLPVPADTVRVATPNGTVVATVSVQARNLRKIFQQVRE